MYFYKTHPLTCAKDDFWGQVKRTVNGKPVSEEQIRMIVEDVRAGLDFQPDDRLLDLCCGNGALTRYFYPDCESCLGVDFSEPLIAVAREYFERPPDFLFRLEDVVEFARAEPQPERFTKALCYGSFQYLEHEAAAALLRLLRERFTGLRRFYVGNIPDKDRIRVFAGDKGLPTGQEDDPGTPIGIWRSTAEFGKLAGACGWEAGFSTMPEDYYAAAYRYNAVLTPLKEGGM